MKNLKSQQYLYKMLLFIYFRSDVPARQHALNFNKYSIYNKLMILICTPNKEFHNVFKIN